MQVSILLTKFWENDLVFIFLKLHKLKELSYQKICNDCFEIFYMIAYLILLVFLLITSLFRANKKFKPFDIKATIPLRGLLALCIIMHHTSQVYGIDSYILSPFRHFITLGAPIVAMFFFLSGYGLCISLYKKGRSYINGFFFKRISTYLPELIFLTSIALIVFYFKGNSIECQIEKAFNGFPPLPSSWFLYALTFIYVAFLTASLISRFDSFKTGIYLSLLVLFYAITLRLLGFGHWWYYSLPAVSLGYFTAFLELNIKESIIRKKLLIISLICILVLCCFFSRSFTLVRLIGINISTLAIYSCVKLFGFPNWKCLNFIGSISLNIYLTQGLILDLLPCDWNGYLAYLFIVLSSIIVALVLKYMRSLIKIANFKIRFTNILNRIN